MSPGERSTGDAAGSESVSLAGGPSAQPVSSLLLGVFSGRVGVGGAEPRLGNERVKGVHLHLVFVMVSKYEGTLLFDFAM